MDYSNLGPVSSSVQLWQFLLELLTDKQYVEVIRWVGKNGEFEFLDADRVALLWGERKGYANMNYSKLTRALRNYYSTGILSKVTGHQYLYKFMFDIKFVLGYSVEQITNLIYT